MISNKNRTNKSQRNQQTMILSRHTKTLIHPVIDTLCQNQKREFNQGGEWRINSANEQRSSIDSKFCKHRNCKSNHSSIESKERSHSFLFVGHPLMMTDENDAPWQRNRTKSERKFLMSIHQIFDCYDRRYLGTSKIQAFAIDKVLKTIKRLYWP